MRGPHAEPAAEGGSPTAAVSCRDWPLQQLSSLHTCFCSPACQSLVSVVSQVQAISFFSPISNCLSVLLHRQIQPSVHSSYSTKHGSQLFRALPKLPLSQEWPTGGSNPHISMLSVLGPPAAAREGGARVCDGRGYEWQGWSLAGGGGPREKAGSPPGLVALTTRLINSKSGSICALAGWLVWARRCLF